MNDVLDKLTIDEKLSLLRGSTTWETTALPQYGIQSVCGGDGPTGVKRFDRTGALQSSTVFPCPSGLACSFDVQLVGEVAKAVGEEARHYKIAALYAPGVNIQRSPLCGRTFEYFSEDPYLSSEMGIAYVKGVQSTGTMATVKHFAVNNQEYLRRTISARVDERALREIYLKPFERVVKIAKPRAIMAAYNKINGVYATENARLLTDILRNEWGFDGLVMSDWGAINDRALAVTNGCDLEMPYCAYSDEQLKKALAEGRLTVGAVDAAARRVLDFVAYGQKNTAQNFTADFDAHHNLAIKAAEASAVLLKNDGATLPLGEEKILIVGKMAQKPHYQGTGSSQCKPRRPVFFLDALKNAGRDFDYEPSLSAAIKKARGYDKVVVFAGLDRYSENEGDDREHMRLPARLDKNIAAIAQANPSTVVVLHNGAPVEMPWIDRVKSVLLMHLAGESVGEATYRLLYGLSNPCGKLAHTYPVRYSDYLVSKYFPMGDEEVQYRESIFVGYRYFDAADKRVAFPFGHGLSYTEFEFSDLETRITDGKIDVSCTVKNTGGRDGAQIVQVYLADNRADLPKAVKELKAFSKAFLKAGEEKRVCVSINLDDLRYYDVAAKRRTLGDRYRVYVGASSRDIRLTAQIAVDGDAPCVDYYPARYRNLNKTEEIREEDFNALLGGSAVRGGQIVKGEVTEYSPFKALRVRFYGKLVYAAAMLRVRTCIVSRQTKKSWIADTRNNPIRYLYFNGSRKYSPAKVDALVKYVNGGKLVDFVKETRAANRAIRAAEKAKKK